jgi:putative transposase
VIRTPIRAPNATAFAERWVRTVRGDCLDRILIVGRRHLDRVLRVCATHYNEHRPHRALHLTPPEGGKGVATDQTFDVSAVHRQDLLGGLIHEYRQAA